MTPSTPSSPAAAPAPAAGDPQRAASGPEPRFAVVVTVKNGRKWIEEAIGSIAPALSPGGELVVVDAVSTDGTTEYLRGLTVQLPLRLVVEPCSMGKGRDRGVRATHAPVVVTQADADVRYRSEAFREGLRTLDEHPRAGLVLVIGRHDPDPDGTKLFVWRREFYLSTPGYPDANMADDVVALRQALQRGKVARCLVDRVGDDLRVASRAYVAVQDPWKKGPGFLRLSRRRYTQGWNWRTYVRFLWATRRTLPRFLAGFALASVARLAPAP